MKGDILDIFKIDQSKLSSINIFLEFIKNNSNSLGVILWELNSNNEYLFVVADSFKNKIHPPMPSNQSATGEAIRKFEPIYISDVTKNKSFYTKTSFWLDTKVKSFFIIPIKFENGEYGALNIYSTVIDGFSIQLQNELITISSILPSWYCSLLDRATYMLLKQIDVVLKKIEASYVVRPVSKDEMKQHFKTLCEYVSDTFQSFETSIILKYPLKSDVEYECLSSTWLTNESKIFYKATIDDGLTGWILLNKTPVFIPDLMQFYDKEQKEIIQRQYPGIKWNAMGDIKLAVMSKLSIKEEKFLPPMGFIGTPIFIGDELLGVIRCCAALKSPYYFGTRELEILKLIATRIGEVWNSWIQYSLIREDSKKWQKIINTTNQLDGSVLNELIKPRPNILDIFKEVLSSIPNLVKDAEIMDVRLFNSQKNTLYFASTHGDAWENGLEEEKKTRYEKEFKVDGINATSAGAQVFLSKKALILDPIDKERDHYDGTFKQTTRMILAPLLIRDKVLGIKVLGILDVRSTSDRPFQNTALHAVELMAGQLAIYHALVDAVMELQKSQKLQLKTFQDFEHQFRSPIYQASVYARKVQNEASTHKYLNETTLLNNINATAGLCNKAYRVATNLQLFSDLSKNLPLQVKKSFIKYPTIIKLLIEAAIDSKVGISPGRNLEIYVDKESFYILDEINVTFDSKMLEQVINILLDNAIKYSHKNTTIYVFGELFNNQFQLVVKNKGIPIKEKETTLCRIRGWRSSLAKLVTGEGGGIGLWVLDKIMDSHGGSLMIIPTDKEGNTEIKIIFSNKKTTK